jgi:hypothetical protein
MTMPPVSYKSKLATPCEIISVYVMTETNLAETLHGEDGSHHGSSPLRGSEF